MLCRKRLQAISSELFIDASLSDPKLITSLTPPSYLLSPSPATSPLTLLLASWTNLNVSLRALSASSPMPALFSALPLSCCPLKATSSTPSPCFPQPRYKRCAPTRACLDVSQLPGMWSRLESRFDPPLEVCDHFRGTAGICISDWIPSLNPLNCTCFS